MDPSGKIRQSTINDLPIGRSVDETLRLVKAIQFYDTSGEVCPAEWKPGQTSIVPNHQEKLKYFEQKHQS
jgi:peroxiredoxin 2/4